MRQLLRYWRVAAVVALVLVAGMIGRLSQNAGSARYSHTASGGVAAPMMDMAPVPGGEGAGFGGGANSGYDEQYREAGAAGKTESKAWNSPESSYTTLDALEQEEAANPANPEPKPQPGQTGPVQPAGTGTGRSAIDEWFSPAAYAEDHKIDEKYIVRTGNLEIKTDSVKDSVQKINAVAEKYGGNVSDSSISKDDSGHHSGSVTLRVPSAKFREAFEDLAAIGEAINRNESSTDLGQDYVASVSHMKTLVAEQATLQKMLDEALAVQRSRGLGEAYSVLLDTERRLSEVTEELRAVGEHVNAMADQITRSTITVSLSENPTLPASEPNKFNWGIGATFKQAVRDLMTGTRDLVNGIIYFVVSLQWIWWLLLFFVGRWVWRWFLKQKGLAGGRPAGK